MLRYGIGRKLPLTKIFNANISPIVRSLFIPLGSDSLITADGLTFNVES